MVTNIYFESIVPSMKNNLFYQRKIDFLDKQEFNDHRY